MKLNLKTLKKYYDMLRDERLRSMVLMMLETIRFPKGLVRMDVNDTCNIECVMCTNKPEKCSRERYMGFEDFKRVIDLIAADTRLLYLSCAFEPLMTPDFPKYFTYAKSKKIPFISFATNGMMLNQDVSRQLVDEQINEVIISFNGPEKDDYNRIMHRSNFDLVMKNLAFLKEYKQQKGSIYPGIRFNIILMKTNLVKFDKLAALINEYNVAALQFRDLFISHTMNNYEEVKKEDIATLPEKELSEIMVQVNALSKELAAAGKEVILPQQLMAGSMKSSTVLENVVRTKTHCSVPYFSSWILHDGNYRICPSDDNGVIGNIIKDPYGEIIKKRNKFRGCAFSGKCARNCSFSNLDSTAVL